MADVKALLKRAREAVVAKSYEEAQELCECILRADRNNYMGLVLHGVSLQQSAQAPLAFHKAIEVDRAKPLAWQGLATYYEKHEGDDAVGKLLSVYKEMLKLDVEPDKVPATLVKIGQLGLSAQTTRAVGILAQYADATADNALRQTAQDQLLRLLSSEAGATCNDKSVLAIVENLLQSYPENDKLSLNYVKLIAKYLEFPEFMKKVRNLNGFSNNKLLREWTCRYIFEEYVSKGTLHNWDVKLHEEELTREVDTTASSMVKCVALSERGLYKEAYELAIGLVDPKRLDDVLIKFLVKSSMHLSNWEVTEKLICQVMHNIKNENTIKELKSSLLVAYFRQEKWKEGAALGLELRAHSQFSIEQSHMLAQCFIHENMKEIDEIINKLQNTEYYDSLIALRHIKSNQLKEAREVLENSTSNTSNRWLYLGIVYWKLDEKEKSLIPLLRSTKLDPGQSVSFVYLGHYYKRHALDLQKAKKCYVKAFSLNTSNSEAARSLSKLYRELGEDDANYKLLQKVSSSIDQKEYWPKMQLGLYYLSKRNCDEAIKHFRSVIRVCSKDSVAWVSLADAYYARGSFTSALKCYTKVMELHPTENVYPETQIANINHLLGLYPEAITNYKNVLVNDPKCVIALKGIASTLKAIAEQQMTQHCYGLSRDNAQLAIEYTVRAITVAPSLTVLWKILGDTLMLMTKYPVTLSYTHLPGEVFGENIKDSVYKSKLDIFPIAIGCYGHAIKTTTFDMIPLYYDISLAYWQFYKESEEVVHCQKAFAAAEHCIKNKPGIKWEYWNMLGIISMSDVIKREDYAQYCFLKAIILNKSSAEVWTNLGVLYLHRRDYRAANKAFQRAQETDPAYPYSWAGQALIAEVVREEEAMDLFRHTTELGFCREAAKGYAYWVCRTLQNFSSKKDPKYVYAIENMHALPVALDLMTHVCTFESRDACVTALLGVLQERSGLLRNATASYKTSLTASASQNERNIATLNFGRILTRTGAYPEATQVLQNITEATFSSAVCTGVAFYRNGDYEGAYGSFDAALQWLSDDNNEKADLLVAMAGIVYKFKGYDEAKLMLLKSIKMCETPPFHSLLGLCALGLLHSDKGLSKLALNELNRYEIYYDSAYDIAFLKSYLHLQERENNMFILTMLKGLRLYPWHTKMWHCFADLCIQESRTNARVASAAIQHAINNNEGKVDLTRMWSAASVMDQLCGKKESALLYAKRAIHMCPYEANNWSALLFVLVPILMGTEKNDWLKGLASHVRRRMTPTRPQGHWLGLVERMLEQCTVKV